MNGRLLLKFARQATESYIQHNQYITPPQSLPSEVLVQRACYVSIFENPGKHIRAMYGHPLPRHHNIAQEVIANTIEAIRNQSAGSIRPVDLSYLIYSVAVLGPLERISAPEHLDPKRYGLYIRSDRGKSSVLLPQRAGIDLPQEQIATAMREAGIDQRVEAVSMYRFFVEYFE